MWPFMQFEFETTNEIDQSNQYKERAVLVFIVIGLMVVQIHTNIII